MDRLWAPWRVVYIKKMLKKREGCVFCKMFREKKDAANYIFIRKNTCYSVLNIYPYNSGHSMILVNRHVDDLSKLTAEEKKELFELLETTQGLLAKIFKPDGFNIGINLGRAAGAGFPKHLHIHVVPRWKADANFMPVIGNTRVLTQSLNIIYKQLVHAYKKRH